MKIGVLQMDVIKGDRQANLEKAQRLAAEAAALAVPPDALVLPELWSTGYALERAGNSPRLWAGRTPIFSESLRGGIMRHSSVVPCFRRRTARCSTARRSLTRKAGT